jgi:predicted peroxiredoxin
MTTWTASISALAATLGLLPLRACRAAARKGPPLEAAPGAAAALDLRGKKVISYVVYEARKALDRLADGEILSLWVDAYDGLEGDLAIWMDLTGQRLAGEERAGGIHRYDLVKAPPRAMPEQLAIMVSRPGLTDLFTPLSLALAGRLAGMETHVFFQGPGVRVLKKGYDEKLPGLWAPFSVFARRQAARTGHVRPQEKLAELVELGAHLHACPLSLEQFGVRRDELAFPVELAQYYGMLATFRESRTQIFLQ